MHLFSGTDNPYETLGVDRHASAQAIKQAYRLIALETHPDRNPGDEEAAERFRRASRAYAVLQDASSGGVVDSAGEGAASSIADALHVRLEEAVEIFSRAFDNGREAGAEPTEVSPPQASRAPIPIDITLEEVEHGGTRRIPCPCARCHGSGAREGSIQVRCTSCGGSGRLRHMEQRLLGPKLHTMRCESCRGSGRRPLLECPTCAGSGTAPGSAELTIRIPRGVRNGEELPGTAGVESRMVARLQDDHRWARDGADLYVTAQLRYEVAVLGGSIDLELPGRTFRLVLPRGTGSGHRIRIPEEGLPQGERSGRGDLIVTTQIVVPEQLSLVQRCALLGRQWTSADVAGREDGGVLTRAHARAWAATRRRWIQWRESHHRLSLSRIEMAAASLRSAAVLLRDSEARVGPLLEQGFESIAPQAAQARRRLHGLPVQSRNLALSTGIIDLVVSVLLTASLWWGAREAALGPLQRSALEPLLRYVDPLALALLPVAAGLSVGALRVSGVARWIRWPLSVPLHLATTAAAVAAGALAYTGSIALLPIEESARFANLAWLAGTVGCALVFAIFLLMLALVENVRDGIAERKDRTARRILRSHDAAASRLGDQLERTEAAFRQLLVRAEDEKNPLTSLLSEAAQTLSADRHRRPQPSTFHAISSLVAGVALTATWLASATLTVVTIVSLLEPGGPWAKAALAATVLVLCGVGVVIPSPLQRPHRAGPMIAALAVTLSILALGGLLVGGAGGPLTGWLALAAGTAALALSFQLAFAVRATAVAAALSLSALFSVVLSPFAVGASLAHGLRRRREYATTAGPAGE